MLAQILVALVLFMAVYWLVSNVISNLERQNIASGFGFFNERAGFGINQTLIDYNEDNSYGRVLAVGLLNTLLVSVLGIAAASFLGFFIGIGRLSQNWLISKMAMVYVEIFRNVPLLLQIMFWYFGVLRNLPVPRQSLSLGEFVFLNNRGFMLPAIQAGAGAVWYLLAVIVGVGAFLVQTPRPSNAGGDRQYRVGLAPDGHVFLAGIADGLSGCRSSVPVRYAGLAGL